MRVPTAADTDELRRIVNQACRDAHADVKRHRKNSRFHSDAVNWADLGFVELEMRTRVIVEEASPDANELRQFIWERLQGHRFDVEVVTEW